MGFEQFSIKLAEDPALVRAIWEKVAEIVHAEFQDAIQRDVVGAIWYVDDIAIKDRLMASPTLLREELFPRLKLIADGCQTRGIPLIYHTDGNVMRVLDDIIGLGINALHPIDPTGMDIYGFKPKVEGKLSVIGNIDIDILTLGTPQEVVADTKKHIRKLAPGGGYVVSSSNSVVRSFKPENYSAMLETVRKYGIYPINI
ncbi:uroporphyrinogen decarboxylase family protein [Thermodesulfobacteriota bacterium]